MSASSTIPGHRWLPHGRLEGLLGGALRTEPEANREEIGFEDRLEHDFAAAMITRSPSAGMPSGRVSPGLPGLGMCTRRSGLGR